MDVDKAIDLEYLKLTVALVLLLIIVFMITSRFRTYPKKIQQQSPTNTGFAAGSSNTERFSNSTKTENFAPYASILTPVTFRSDASHDTGKNDFPPSGNFVESSLNGIK